jgi:hypothetical protein
MDSIQEVDGSRETTSAVFIARAMAIRRLSGDIER